MTSLSHLPKVKAQYEHFPYPPRHPDEERKALRSTAFDSLDSINHFGFSGKRNFYSGFRVLVAGGGTGDSAIYLAEQLRDSDAEIIHLDLSQSSIDIAKARAATRKLSNIQFMQASLLDVASLGIGKFDYINCSGVLHHLESPDAGLAALESVLAPGGMMTIMVYGRYGRAAIYQMQEMLRLIAGDEDDTTKLNVCKTALGGLPPTNWLHHCKNWLSDLNYGDAGIYDLLLHSQDRPYSVPELYEFIEKAGLHIITGLEACDPARYIKDKALLERVQALPLPQQYAIGELLCGTQATHSIYASREPAALPSPEDTSMIPSLSVNMANDIYTKLHETSKSVKDHISFSIRGVNVLLPVSPAMTLILEQMNGKHSLNDIYAAAAQTGKAGMGELQQAFKTLYNLLSPAHVLFLRAANVSPYLTTHDIQAKFIANGK